MPAPDWERLDDHFFREEDFGDVATIALEGGETIERVPGIFDDPYFNGQLGEYELDGSQPRFTCSLARVHSVGRGDRATINGRTYDVMSAPQSDGTDMCVLILGEPYDRA